MPAPPTFLRESVLGPIEAMQPCGTACTGGYARSSESLFSAPLKSLQAGHPTVDVSLFLRESVLGPIEVPIRRPRQARGLALVAIVHHPFHVMKRAGEAVDEVRRQVLFRAGPELRAVGRGKRWLFLRAHARLTEEQRRQVAVLLRANHTLMHAYTVKEHLRDVLRSDSQQDMDDGLRAILLPEQTSPCASCTTPLVAHLDAIVALGKHQPPTGRIEALSNN